MIKIINLFKSIKSLNFNNFAFIFIIIFALIQGVYIYLLKSSNEGLELALKTAEQDKAQMEAFIKNQQIAINELEIAVNEKENLNKEIKKQREKILKDLGDDKIIEKPLRDSVDFIISRLREKSTDD